MAMKACRDCGKEISTTARACPHCGAKVPRTKWWLWVPLGLVALFLAIGFSVPEHEAQARRSRELCEQMIGGRGTARQHECDRLYSDIIRKGESDRLKR